MKITQEETANRQAVLHIELEEEDLAPYLDRGYSRVVQRATIPGFRKGKAPRAIIEQYLGRESLLHEAMDFILPEVTQQAIAAQNLETVGTPNIDLLELEPLTLKATVPLTPLVDLGVYRDIRVAETPIEITDDDIRQRLQELLKDAASWEPVDRPVKLGDMVTMDVTATVEDRAILDEKDAVYVTGEENSPSFPGLSQSLEGAEVAVPKQFTLTTPNDHADTRLAGKEAHFRVKVSEVKEQKLPELDDEFAKSVGEGYDSIDAFRVAIEQELKAEAQKTQLAQYREAVLNQTLKVATVELPPLLIDHEVEHMMSRRDRLVDSLNMRKDDYLRLTGKTEEETQKEMRERAEEHLARSFVLATLAEREGLKVSAEEIDERLQAIASSQDQEAESLGKQDLDSEELRNSIQRTLLVGKALDRLVETARGEVQESTSKEQGFDSVEQNTQET